MKKSAILFVVTVLSVVALGVPVRKGRASQTPYIPPQCYTKTRTEDGRTVNPCYVCHTRSLRPNYINDHQLQLAWSFPEPALENPWTNLFEDRTSRIRAISDREMTDYIRKSNYLDDHGEIILKKRLAGLDPDWDSNDNSRWDGYIPDCRFHFDVQGFDRTPEGGYSGWRVFAYYPFPTTYWPSGGSPDDVMIRLPPSFQENRSGSFDPELYRVNLAIVEALIRERDVRIAPVDERRFGVDLDGDGELGSAEKIRFAWDRGKKMSYVGRAKDELALGKVHLAAGLFPEGTEFLQTIRYVDVDKKGETGLSARLKALHYMKKRRWLTYSRLEEAAMNEIKEKDDFPDRTRQLIGNSEEGINNGSGWLLQGFIEDAGGNLRPQSVAETASCVGCHGGTGASTDSVYAFSRKLDCSHFRSGWFHWSDRGLSGLNEPKVRIRGAGLYYEYSYYLMYNRSGSELRKNAEIDGTFFAADGSVDSVKIQKLHDDISTLLSPSPQRAMALNKAYRTIVLDQDFVNGRQPCVSPVLTVHKEVEKDEPTGITQPTSTAGFYGRFSVDGEKKVTGERATLFSGRKTALPGRGLTGPDGKKYEVDRQGIIHKNRHGRLLWPVHNKQMKIRLRQNDLSQCDIQINRYSQPAAGVHFTFPPRLTLPTRIIVPLGRNPVCYRCHRLLRPTVSGREGLVKNIPEITKTFLPETMTPLTVNEGRDVDPLWSPDGDRIVFVSNRCSGDQLWLVEMNSRKMRQLTTGPGIAAWPAWSQDGRQLVFWAYDEEEKLFAIKLLDLASGVIKNLVQSRSMLDRPVFHPGGRLVAYAGVTENNWDIWLVDIKTLKKQRLTHDPQMETNPLWSPNGEILAYKVAPGGDYSLTVENFMSFAQGYSRPTVYSWDGPESVQMSDWSPDGNRITYTAEIISDSSGEDRVTYVAMVSDLVLENGRARAENTEILSKGRTLGDRGPVFSSDGNKIAFWGWDTKGYASLWLNDLRNNTLKKLTEKGNDTYPSWSPDGSHLVFESTRNGNSDLLFIAVNTDK